MKEANAKGVAAIVRQQFDVAKQVLAHRDWCPMIEPEIDIKCPDKAAAEKLLRKEILAALDELAPGQLVMLKLTLPEEDDFYQSLPRAPQRPEGRRALRWLLTGRGERPFGAQPWDGRQLLAGARRGACR